MNMIIYFSAEGHTRKAAFKLHELISSEIFEIKTKIPYPKNHKKLLEVAKKQWENHEDVELENGINIDEFDTIYLCYPNWFGTVPLAVAGFLKSHDFTDKQIVAICTHGGSGLRNGLKDIEKLAEGVNIGGSLAINSADIK